MRLPCCHLRTDLRIFRLSRMDNLAVTSHKFTRPSKATMHEFMMSRQEPSRSDTIIVQALFDNESTQWVRERFNFFVVAQAETHSGLLLTLRIRHENEIVQWLLGWGRHVQVLEPPSLRERLAREAQAMLDNHQTAVPEIPESLNRY